MVSHSRFDVASLSAACGKMNRLAPELRWVDSCQVARLVWQQFREDGYGLSRLAQRLGIQFSHHDAVEDARAAGLVLCRALRDSGKSVEEFVEQTSIVPMSAPRARRYRPSDKDSVKQNGNAEGKLLGEVVVFTGTLSIPRKEAALRAAQAGCAIDNTVTKRTTTLVVGDQDIRLLAGKKVSSKQARAEELIESGQCIRILQETDFETLIEGALEETSFGVDLIQRDIGEPFRPHMTITELFEGPDRGLISDWEEGRRMERSGRPESQNAKRGE